MAMTDGISVDELEDSSNNSIAEVSRIAEGLVWVCRGRLESVCVCAKGRRVEDCDGSSELLRAPANLGAFWQRAQDQQDSLSHPI